MFNTTNSTDTSQFARLNYDGESLADAQKRKREAREAQARREAEISDLEKMFNCDQEAL